VEIGENQTNQAARNEDEADRLILPLNLIGSHADVQVGELAEHLAVFKVQAPEETGIIQSGLAA